MTDQQKKLAAGGVFVALAAGILFFELSDTGSPSPAPIPAVVTTATPSAPGAGTGRTSAAARRVGTTAETLDPTLRTGPMLVTESVAYSGTGRNIFSGASAPAAIPKPIAPARPKTPVAPVVLAPMGPPPPPPIDLKFFGTATTAGGKRQAFLLKGEDVFLASPGEVVQRRYRIVAIAANSIVVEDMVNNNRQTLPLLTN